MIYVMTVTPAQREAIQTAYLNSRDPRTDGYALVWRGDSLYAELGFDRRPVLPVYSFVCWLGRFVETAEQRSAWYAALLAAHKGEPTPCP